MTIAADIPIDLITETSVRCAQEHTRAGDVFKIVLSQRAGRRTPASALDVARAGTRTPCRHVRSLRSPIGAEAAA
jgi:hypothetical protein